MTTEATAWRALTSGVATFMAETSRAWPGDANFRILIPSQLGELIADELDRLSPDAWLPLTPGVFEYADGKLRQFVLCETVIVGWKTDRDKREKHVVITDAQIALLTEAEKLKSALAAMEAGEDSPDIGDIMDAIDTLTDEEAAPFLDRVADVLGDILRFRLEKLRSELGDGKTAVA